MHTHVVWGWGRCWKGGQIRSESIRHQGCPKHRLHTSLRRRSSYAPPGAHPATHTHTLDLYKTKCERGDAVLNRSRCKYYSRRQWVRPGRSKNTGRSAVSAVRVRDSERSTMGFSNFATQKKPSCLVKMGVGAACGGRVAWEKKSGLHHLDILTLSGVGHCPDVVKIFQDGGGGGLWRAGGVGKNPRFARSAHTSSRCSTSAPDD